MFAELGNILEIAPGTFPGGQRVAVVEASADASFILHHFITQAVKTNKKVVLVAFAQSFSHYNNVASKLGASLATQRDHGNVIVLELLKEIGLGMMNKSLTESQASPGGSMGNLSGNSESLSNDEEGKPPQIEEKGSESKIGNNQLSLEVSMLRNLYQRIENAVKQFDSDTYVIIDDVSMLLSLGFETSSVRFFLHYLNNMVKSNPKTCLVQLIHSSEDPRTAHSADEELEHVSKYLCHVASTVVIVTGLPSGYCRDVHGELTVRWQSAEVGARPEKRMQFKVLDKSVKFFPAGMSAAVL